MKGSTSKMNKGKQVFRGTTRGASLHITNQGSQGGGWQGIQKKGFRPTKGIPVPKEVTE